MSPVDRVRAADRQGPAVTYGALGIVYVVWGSTYLAIRIGIDTIPPLLMAGVRFLLAGAILQALAALTGRGDTARRAPIGRREWVAALIAGGLLFVGGNGGVTFGERSLPSGTVALMVATVPLWMGLIAGLVLKESLTRWTILGIGIGLAGVAFLVQPTPGHRFDALATAVVLASPVCWAAGSLYSRRAPLPRQVARATAMEMLAGGALLVVLSVVTGEVGHVHPERFTAASLLAVAYLVVFGSIVAFSAYNLILRRLPTAVVSTYAYVNPVVAVFLGWLFLAEPITPRLLVSGGVILVAVAIIVSAASRASRADALARDPARLGIVDRGQGSDVGHAAGPYAGHRQQVPVAHGVDAVEVGDAPPAEGVADPRGQQAGVAEVLQGQPAAGRQGQRQGLAVLHEGGPVAVREA
ncbi:MAG TPA: EamA family transporter [Candidatus Dormibacteraeota bacterium]|jgi:drug/metabolite transporter (DMT)-like permease|nr:EamA family transporter [Candidatus Dormibacteraeota bacterium]